MGISGEEEEHDGVKEEKVYDEASGRVRRRAVFNDNLDSQELENDEDDDDDDDDEEVNHEDDDEDEQDIDDQHDEEIVLRTVNTKTQETKENLVYEDDDDDDDGQLAATTTINNGKEAPASLSNLSATAKLRQQLAEFLNEDVDDGDIETTLHEKVDGVKGQFRKGDVIYNLNDADDVRGGPRDRDSDSGDDDDHQPAKKKIKK